MASIQETSVRGFGSEFVGGDGGSREINVGNIERAASVIAGAALMGYGLRKITSSLPGVALAAVGGALVARGYTGHCNLYGLFDISTAQSRSPAVGVPAQQGVRVEKSVMVNCPPSEAYQAWRNLSNLPKFMRHLVSVEDIDALQSHWVARGPMGVEMEWDAELINDRENEMLAWRSLPGSEVDTAGSVHFVPVGSDSTEIRVSLKYDPPGGRVSINLARLMNEDAASMMEEDLQSFKRLLESRQLTARTPSMSAASPMGAYSGKSTVACEVSMSAQGMTDDVDEASLESFPASDPPSFTSTTASKDTSHRHT